MASRSTLGTLGAAAASLAAAVGVGAVVGTVVAPGHSASAARGGLTALVGGDDQGRSAGQQADDDTGWTPKAPALSSGGAVGGGHAQSAGS
ncbi:MAG TPA: hypothetical protein VFS29_11730 [Motilibacteraceae bacterium]|nr:hypothetical protein [Motilibacteraceae bacterium]